MLNNIKKTSVGFKFLSQIPLVLINGAGYQNIISHDYVWNGRNRKDNQCILQYTLSGEGEIEIKGKVYSLKKGDAFLVDTPSDHCYILPDKSDRWEVIYIEFSKEALPLLKKIYDMKGHIVHFDIEEKIVQAIINIYKKCIEDEFKDIYQNSKYAYKFIMDIISYFFDENQNKILPTKIESSKKFIEENYNKLIGLDDIANYINLSKFHFTREFEKEVGMTPGKYIIKIRLKKAIELLTFSRDMTIEEIAIETGFNCGNYFSKVFKKYIGISPSAYRMSNNYEEIRTRFFD